MHPQEKALAKQLAEKSKGKYAHEVMGVRTVGIIELNERADAIDFGAEVVLKGFFVMGGWDGYFVESDAKIWERNRAVMVCHGDLKKKLLSSVPAFGGGECLSGDQAEIAGVLSKSSDGRFLCEITDLKWFLLFKHGQAMSVRL
ncbi:hypothetical protein [Burkholderia sp. Bp9004]|uniref:hypothetical protein n=1 Tax=Burkholderia sp. Bp9004 TaxID=2184559 RepID=UPI000F5F0D6E|nr:hypothetical protein [Burkholderia sp. Bp9004]RQZ65258.1 hypothetical protein DIE08_22525 [Burkholderia sp. Bp9004]